MRRALLVLVVVGLVVAGLARRGVEVAPAPTAAPSSDHGDGGAANGAAAASPDAGDAGGGRPRSLRGTHVDGGLVVDAAGHFVPTIETRRFFDYFLTASGEIPTETLRTKIVAAIERRLPPSEAPAAIALLDQYLDYRARARTLEKSGAPPDDLAGRLEQVSRLRREIFSPQVVDAFFAEEEEAMRREIARRSVAADPTLSADERRAALATIDADAPPEVQEAHAAAVLADTLQQAESALRAQGGTDDAVRALRERLVGQEAAERLATLDRSRAAWRARVDDFRAERARILADPQRTPPERDAAVAALLAARFTAPEQLRVKALDEIAGERPQP